MTRCRLLLLALIVLLLGLIGGVGVHGMRRDREARAEVNSSAGAAGTPGSREDLSPRRAQGAEAAEAKLNSLLAVREGEMAFIRVPAALMHRLGGGVGETALKGALELGDQAPGLVGILNRSAVLASLTGHAQAIEGTMDTSGDEFEWRGARMQVRGTALSGEKSQELKISVTEGQSTLECQTFVPPGAVIFLRTGNPDPEGVLIVIGKNEPGDYPAGDWGR